MFQVLFHCAATHYAKCYDLGCSPVSLFIVMSVSKGGLTTSHCCRPFMQKGYFPSEVTVYSQRMFAIHFDRVQ